MPDRADRPFRPILRTLRTAIIVSIVFAVVGYRTGQNPAEMLLAFLAAFALLSGIGVVLFRHDIADMARARRDG